MITRRWTVVVLLMALSLLFAATAMADQRDKATKVTFNTPVETPAGVLPPGTYIFTVMPDSPNNIVQIWNEDRTKLVGTFLTVPDYRPEAADKPIVMFEKASTSGAPALKAWFYPGEQYGRTFVYPKSKATELAKLNNQNVLSMPDASASNMSKPAQTAQEAPVAALEIVVVKAIKPSGEEVDKDQAVQSRPNR